MTTLGLHHRPDRCAQGFAQVQHDGGLCSCAGLAAKAKGQAIATAAHPDDRAKVERAIRQLAATGRPFSANDARVLHGVKGGVVGAVFTALRKEGLIRRIGREASTSESTHGHEIGMWVAVGAEVAA